MKNNIVHTLLIIVIIIGLLGVGWIVNFNKVIEGDLLAYSGAVIGGGLTLLGVIMTINYQEKTRKEDNEKRDRERKEDFMKMHKPIITIDSIEYSDYNSDNTLGFNIVFKNQGLTEAYNLEIWVHLKNNESNRCSAYCNPSYYSVLPYDSSLSVQATHIELLEKCGDIVEGIDIIITYDDAYKNSYTAEQIAYLYRDINNDLNIIKLSNYNLVNKRTKIPMIQKQL